MNNKIYNIGTKKGIEYVNITKEIDLIVTVKLPNLEH